MWSLSGRLYRFDQVPSEFYELGIVSGYRHPRSSFKDCLLSLFSANNETMNFWTHFLPVWYFAWRLLVLNQGHAFASDDYTWPLLAFVISCCIYPFASAFAHAFNTMSVNARHICFFIDYAALSCYSFGCAMAYKAYVFPKALLGTPLGEWYVHIAFVNAIGCTFVSCRTRFMKPGLVNKAFRLGAFALPYIYDVTPVIYRIFFCEVDDCGSQALWLHTRQFLFAFMSAFLYSSHLPERWLPGSFDIIGHSHQMFHVVAIFATRDMVDATLLDMQERKDLMLNANDPSIYSWSLVAGVTLVVINIATILIHVKRLYQHPPPPPTNNNEEKCHCH